MRANPSEIMGTQKKKPKRLAPYDPKRLAHARRVSGRTQKQMAKDLDVTRTAVSGWEAPRGTKRARTPSTDRLAAIAALILENRTVDYFYGEGSPL